MPNIIPSIHNFCNRWCEKCPFSNKCSVGIQELNLSEEEKNPDNEAFWKSISDQFQKAINLLQQKMDEEGITFTEEEKIKNEEELQKNEDELEEIRKNHPLSTLSWDYMMLARTILQDEEEIHPFQKNLENKLTLGIATEEDIIKEAETIKESYSIIQWHMHFIHVKLIRALTPPFFDEEEDEGEDPLSDKNGSAKIAMLAAEASLGAWHTLYTLSNIESDNILKSMAMLEKILRLSREEFPNAMAFIRPGFDQGWQEAWDMDEEEMYSDEELGGLFKD